MTAFPVTLACVCAPLPGMRSSAPSAISTVPEPVVPVALKPLIASEPASMRMRPSLTSPAWSSASPLPVRRITPVSLLVRASAREEKAKPNASVSSIARRSSPWLTRRPVPRHAPRPSHTRTPSLTSVRSAAISNRGAGSVMRSVEVAAFVMVPVPRNVTRPAAPAAHTNSDVTVRSASPERPPWPIR